MSRICVVQINVTDMDQAIAFYGEALGFQVATRDHYPDIVPLVHPGIPLILYRVDHMAHIDYPHVAQTLINFETPDLAATLQNLKAQGVELIHETPQPCPVGIYAAVRDPFGNVFELLEYQPKG